MGLQVDEVACGASVLASGVDFGSVSAVELLSDLSFIQIYGPASLAGGGLVPPPISISMRQCRLALPEMVCVVSIGAVRAGLRGC